MNTTDGNATQDVSRATRQIKPDLVISEDYLNHDLNHSAGHFEAFPSIDVHYVYVVNGTGNLTVFFHGQLYYVTHGIAIAALVISICFSLGTIIYLLREGTTHNIFKRKIKERLVFYLAVCDLLYSSDHMVDHIYMIVTGRHPPDAVCTTTGFFLQEFATAQSIIVAFTALNGWFLVVKERRLEALGAYDWKLILISLGFPAVFGIVCASLGLLGPSEAWCMADMRKPMGKLVNNLVAVLMTAVFLVDLLSYVSIWWKIDRTQKLLRDCATSSDKQRCKHARAAPQLTGRSSLRAAKIMSCFVLAYILQWWPFIIYSIWSFVRTPHVSLLILNVIFCNLGGLFNCLAYTVIRIRYSARGRRGRSVTSPSANGASVTSRPRPQVLVDCTLDTEISASQSQLRITHAGNSSSDC